jgi:hypothetical protein
MEYLNSKPLIEGHKGIKNLLEVISGVYANKNFEYHCSIRTILTPSNDEPSGMKNTLLRQNFK